jgi:hypothetical protein
MNVEQDGGGLFQPVGDSRATVSEIEKNAADIPPFPLENLIAFLNGEGGGESLFVPVRLDIRALLAVIAALSLYIPGLAYAASGNSKKAGNKLYMIQTVTA